MYGKKSKTWNILLAIIICYNCCIFDSCKSTKVSRGTEDDILAYQRRIGQLEAEIRNINEEFRVSNSRLEEDIGRLESIQSESEGIGDSIDRIIFLFDNYESAVEQLIRDYSEIRDRIKAFEESSVDVNSNILSNDSDENSRVHPVR